MIFGNIREVLIEKHYNGYRDRASIDSFLIEYNKYTDWEESPPVFNLAKGN